MSRREIEYHAVSACPFETTGTMVAAPETPWHLSSSSSSSEDNKDALTCVYSRQDCTIRLAPMEFERHSRRQHRGQQQQRGSPSPQWKEDLHFHPLLRVPTTTTSTVASSEPQQHGGLGVCLQFEAMAREGVAVALSSDYSGGKTTLLYEVIFGSQGNTTTTLLQQKRRCRRRGVKSSRRQQVQDSNVVVTVPSRVCQERAWTAYWVCLLSHDGKLYAGVGHIPGQQCIGILEDITDAAQQKQQEAEDATPTSGEGGDDDNNENDSDNDDYVPYVGLGNAGTGDRHSPVSLKVRNIRLTTVPDFLATRLKSLVPEQLECVQLGTDQDDNNNAEIKALFQDYQQECQKARARAQKFGVAYKEPTPEALNMPWSEARRLRANPQAGFATGLDLSDPLEKAKQEARKKRFGSLLPDSSTTTATATDSKELQETAQEEEQEGVVETTEAALPVLQAWDKEEFVRSQRKDPPAALWIVPPPPSNNVEEVKKDEFAMMQESEEPPVLVPEKIHVFSMDWAAFKQIRTNDIMSYFSIYGPSYIEWIGDLSCNVLFQDKYSAARALENLSRELPSPPDELVKQPEHDEADSGSAAAAAAAAASPPPPDFGNMGWRFGKKPLRKVSNDKYGRRGTTARLLMRVATSLDVLKERPSSWPKPPPGFTTKRVLGPASDDFGQQRRRKGQQQQTKRKQRQHKRRRDDYPQQEPSAATTQKPWDPASGQEHPLLSGGLRSGRAGFSVEELEAERAKKRAKAAASEED